MERTLRWEASFLVEAPAARAVQSGWRRQLPPRPACSAWPTGSSPACLQPSAPQVSPPGMLPPASRCPSGPFSRKLALTSPLGTCGTAGLPPATLCWWVPGAGLMVGKLSGQQVSQEDLPCPLAFCPAPRAQQMLGKHSARGPFSKELKEKELCLQTCAFPGAGDGGGETGPGCPLVAFPSSHFP